MANGLTPFQSAVLAYITERIQTTGRSPNYTEIARSCGLAGARSAAQIVTKLSKVGLVTIHYRGGRPLNGMRRSIVIRLKDAIERRP